MGVPRANVYANKSKPDIVWDAGGAEVGVDTGGVSAKARDVSEESIKGGQRRTERCRPPRRHGPR